MEAVSGADKNRNNPPQVGAHKKEQSARKGQLHARLFSRDDLPVARLLIRQHHEVTLFRDEKFSDQKLERQFELILSHPPGMIGISVEYQGNVVGLAWASANGYMLTDGPPIVSVNLIAVHLGLRPIRRAKVFLSLVHAVRQWAAAIDASHTFLHVTTGFRLAATDKLLKGCGARLIGGSYVLPT